MKDAHGGNIWQASARSGIPASRILDFSSSINPLGAPSVARRAAKKALFISGAYPDPLQTDLRRSISLYHGVKADEVIAGSGSTELIYALPRLFPAGRALIAEPAFSEYRRSLTAAGWKADSCISGERLNFTPDVSALGNCLKKKRYSLVWLANPSNPAGTLSKRGDVLRLAELCKAVGAMLAVDEAFMDFADDESVIRSAPKAENIIVLRSLTKFYSMAGLRLGYAVSSKRLIGRLFGILPPWSVNAVAESAGQAALSDAGFRKRTLKWLKAERKTLFDGVNRIRGLKAFPSGANYFAVKIEGARLTAPELADFLFDKGILIRDLSAWRGLGNRFFRVAVKDRKSNAALLTALRQIFKD